MEPSPQRAAGVSTHPPSPAGRIRSRSTLSGRIADGYGVQDEPWLVLMSATGRGPLLRRRCDLGVAESECARTPGPQRAAKRARQAPAERSGGTGRTGFSHLPACRGARPGRPAARRRVRAGRPHPRRFADYRSCSTRGALGAAPCRAEFGLLATAAAAYGRRVAFLGADVNDDPGDARAFLAQHQVSYPSYQMASRN